MLRQRRGHANDDHVAFCKFGKIACRAKPACCRFRCKRRIGHRLDIGPASVERDDLAGIDVEPGDGETAARQGDRKGQADIAKTNDAGLRLPRFNFS